MEPWSPLFAGFVPIGFAQSSTGEYAGGIFWVLGIALLISWLVAVTFTPYLGVKMLKVTSTDHHSESSLYQTAGYSRLRRIISWCVDYRKTVVTATVLLLLLAIFGMATMVHKQFFPSSDRPEVLISVFQPQGSSIKATDKTVQKLEAILKEMDEVKTLSAYIGAGPPRFFISENPELPNPAFAKLIVVTKGEEARNNKCRYFCESLFWASQPNQAAKITRQLMPPAAPIRPRHLVSTQQGVETLAPNDFTVFRDALQVFYVSLRKPARRYTYRRLKIFTSLSLRFQDFQRA